MLVLVWNTAGKDFILFCKMAIHFADAFNFVKSHLIILGVISYSEGSCLHSTFKCISCFVFFVFVFRLYHQRPWSTWNFGFFLQCERCLLNTLVFACGMCWHIGQALHGQSCVGLSQGPLSVPLVYFLVFLKGCFGLDTIGRLLGQVLEYLQLFYHLRNSSAILGFLHLI